MINRYEAYRDGGRYAGTDRAWSVIDIRADPKRCVASDMVEEDAKRITRLLNEDENKQ